MTNAQLSPSERSDDFTNRLRQAMRRHAIDTAAPTPEAEPTAEPVAVPAPAGQGDLVVLEGDCMSSIAAQTGHLWQTIWDEPANAELKDIRKDPNVLAIGDRMTIPPLRPKSEPGETDRRHKFVRIGQPTIFRLRLAENGNPLANQEYTLRFEDGTELCSATNDRGQLECPMPSTARRAKLTLRSKEESRDFALHFGNLEPTELLRGVQQRLRHLGFYSGPIDGAYTKQVTAAIKSYQISRGLEPTATADAETCDRLREEHGA